MFHVNYCDLQYTLGIYINKGPEYPRFDRRRGPQLFRAVLSCHDGTRIRPRLTVALRGSRGRTLTLPHITYAATVRCAALRPLYRLQDRLVHGYFARRHAYLRARCSMVGRTHL